MPLKRIVLPGTLGAFSLSVFLIILGDGRFGTAPLVLGGIVLALVANALYVQYAVRFCTDCGATTARIGKEPWRCASCGDRTRTP